MQTKIYKNTFKGCTSLTSMTLPTSVLSIDEGAFQGCTSLKQFNMGSQVTFVGTSAFCGDAALTSIDRLNDSDGSHTFDIVGDYAFSGIGVKKAKLSLRSSSIYTFWGDGCFQDCKSLSEVNILSANYLSKDMFKGCTALSKVTFDKNMMAYTYPSVFEGCTSLRSITMPSKLLFVSENMFKNCTNLTSVNFSDYSASNSGIKLVQKNAFNGCQKLNNVHLPASIESLDQIEDASLCATSITDLYLHGINVSEIGTDKKLPIDVWYGTPYIVQTIEQFDKILQLRNLLRVPLLVITEFKVSFWYNCNNIKDLFLSYIDKTLIDKPLPFMEENEYFSRNTVAPLATLDPITWNGKDYSMKLAKGIVVRAIIDVGTAEDNGQTISAMLKRHHNLCRTELVQNKNYRYNLITYLTHLKLAKYANLTIYNVRGSSIFAKSKSAKISSYSGNTCNISDNFTKMLYSSIFQSSTDFYQYCTHLKQQTLIPVKNITLSETIKNTQLFRRLTASNYSCTVHCLDDTIVVSYENGNAYVAPQTWESNKTAITNFRVGTWYYNARQIYQYARARNTPCLFIYSLLGCGPCQIYQSNIWNNVEFQTWSAKQKFFLCGLEVTKQPFYDTSLAFCVDELSPSAQNFAKIDQGESVDTKQANAFDEKFYRAKNDTNAFSSNLMTPVLVLMDKNGNCWDYTYHNISQFMNQVGADGIIQCLKSLCLYHFDNNSLTNPTYVVDAVKPFDKYDYISYSDENPWQIASNAISLAKSGIETVQQAVDNMLAQLLEAEQDNGGLYLGGCLFLDIDFLQATVPSAEYAATASDINAILSQWYIRIGTKYYQLTVDSSKHKSIRNPCGTDSMMTIFLASFVEKTYPQ